MTSVLVSDGDERAALAVVRSLGRAGYAVHVCAPRRRSLAAVSRRAVASLVVPDPLKAPAEFAGAAAAYVASRRIDVVLPIAEASLLAALEARAAFAPAVVPFPSIETFRAASDKQSLMALAAQVGIGVPQQAEIGHPDDLTTFDADALSYPVVIKPARSIGEHGGARAKHTVRHAKDPSELRRRLAELPPSAFPLLVQQRIVGPGTGVFLLRWQGATVASFAHRRLLEKPPAGGVSVYAESIAADPDLTAQSERLLAALGWEGVAMVEYKTDSATGRHYLMEVNGRFWGSLQLAIDAGVDFPLLLTRLALGESIAASPPYRIGVRGRWWWGEVDHVLARLRRSNAELALPAAAPSRRWTLQQFVARWRRNEHDAVLRLDDPMPFLNESVRWLKRQ